MRKTVGNAAYAIGWISFVAGLIVWLLILFTRSGEYDLQDGLYSFRTVAYLTLGIPVFFAPFILCAGRWIGAFVLCLAAFGLNLLIFGQRLIQAFAG